MRKTKAQRERTATKRSDLGKVKTGRGRTTNAETEKQSEELKQEPERDIADVRAEIHKRVKTSATKIVEKVIEVTVETGQLASAKYLLEAAGLYPVTEETGAKPRGDSLAEMLLRRLGLPTEPGLSGEDSEPSTLGGVAEPVDPKTLKLATEGSGSDGE